MFTVYDHYISIPDKQQNVCATGCICNDLIKFRCKHCGEESGFMNSCGSWFVGQLSPTDRIEKVLKDHLDICIEYQSKIRKRMSDATI